MFVSYAQNFEDVMLWRALKGVEGGFYVDVGAQDPVVDSTSLAFYQHGWRGVHIEPVPAYAKLLRERRPDEVVIQALVGSTNCLMPFFELPQTGLSTTSRDTAMRHKEAGFVVQESLMPCVTLAEALSPFLGREIHWLKIDVEGSERQVLEGWGLKLKPWVVVIESTVPLSQIESNQHWESLILSLGYKFAYFDGLNRFFVSSEHAELLDAFRYGPTIFDAFSLSGTSTAPFCISLTAELEALRAHNRVVGEELEEREQQTREALRSLADQESKLAESLGQVEALKSDIVYLRSHIDMLRENVTTLQQRAANVDQEHTRELETARDAGRTEILELQHQRDHWWSLADQWHSDLQSLYGSRSWRLTAPLRRTRVLGRAAAGTIKRGIVRLTQFPRRLLRRALLACLAHVERRPDRKALVARLLNSFPSVRDRLTTFAWANRNRAHMDRSPGRESSIHQDGNVHWELYPASARHAYGELMEAREASYAETAPDR